jgi:hypothetical protein
MEHLLFKATLAAAVLTFLIILFTRKENNYLSAAGGNTKKLMVVDQTTGAITFLNNSVQGINEQFANNDATIESQLKLLLGTTLDGNTDGFIFDIVERAKVQNTRVEAIDTALDKRLKAVATTANAAIPDGHRIKIESEHGTGKWKMLADQACDHKLSASGDGGDGQAYSADGAAWCASVKVHPHHRIKMVG